MPKLSNWSTLQAEARRCDLSVDFLRRKVRRGELAHVRVGNRIRVRPEDVESLLSGRQPRAKAAER